MAEGLNERKDAEMGGTCSWTKGRSGEWLVRIPADMWEGGVENGEVPVRRRDGETSHVTIVRASKPFTGRDGRRYVLGTPMQDRPRRRRSRTSGHRCEMCGGTRNVHLAHDMSGLSAWVCDGCDDGDALSIM